MVRGLKLMTVLASGALFVSGAAWSCEKHQAKASSEPKADASPAPAAEALPDLEVAATCSCGGASDCTCKKGKCACKNCRHNRLKSSPLFEKVGGSKKSTELPKSARQEARAGYFI